MKKFTFKTLAEEIIKRVKKPLTADEIWNIALQDGIAKNLKTSSKNPSKTIRAQIYADIRKYGDQSQFIKIDSKPIKFFLKGLVPKEELNQIIKREKAFVETPKPSGIPERLLHPFLTYFAFTYMNCYTKTIYHEKSSRRSFSQWLHPDMVGVSFPLEDWATEVIDFAKEIGSVPIVIYSFEIKRNLGFHNLRESFFQTVSNSSWANEGYLVVADLEEDEDLTNELKRLSSSFGIGVIKIDIDNPDSSEIKFQARHKTELDWDTMDKLAKENPDFRKFLNRVKTDIASKEIRKEWYDEVLSPEDLTQAFRGRLKGR